MKLIKQHPHSERSGDGRSQLTFLDAAAIVLKRAKQPLTGIEITKRAIQQELIQSSGLTPTATMLARLYKDVQNPNSRFQRIAQPGLTRAVRNSVKWALRWQATRN